jgi:hypothetical protein
MRIDNGMKEMGVTRIAEAIHKNTTLTSLVISCMNSTIQPSNDPMVQCCIDLLPTAIASERFDTLYCRQ